MCGLRLEKRRVLHFGKILFTFGHDPKGTRLNMKKITKEDEAKFSKTVACCRTLEYEINLSICELNDGLELLKQQTIIKLTNDYRQAEAVS